MKKDNTKYVTRSVYQFVVEGNKKLLRDIKLLIGEDSLDRQIAVNNWKAKFKENEDLQNFMKEFLSGNLPPIKESPMPIIKPSNLTTESKIARLEGEFLGMLEGICFWDIPKELKEKLQTKINELKK